MATSPAAADTVTIDTEFFGIDTVEQLQLIAQHAITQLTQVATDVVSSLIARQPRREETAEAQQQHAATFEKPVQACACFVEHDMIGVVRH